MPPPAAPAPRWASTWPAAGRTGGEEQARAGAFSPLQPSSATCSWCISAPPVCCLRPLTQSKPPRLTFQRSLASVTKDGSTGSSGVLLEKARSTALFTCTQRVQPTRLGQGLGGGGGGAGTSTDDGMQSVGSQCSVVRLQQVGCGQQWEANQWRRVHRHLPPPLQCSGKRPKRRYRGAQDLTLYAPTAPAPRHGKQRHIKTCGEMEGGVGCCERSGAGQRPYQIESGKARAAQKGPEELLALPSHFGASVQAAADRK